ncbi:hypothetical protein BTN50_1339 [Candidatus Enterovibrio altilux]|uniref:Uncharacterized protein n=1 Tax=Candidatus Enterovibrio altilux TaxID=1927128 RepID=A0A291B9X1_9GAMM|nr:hypothetical protein BTN50_1339 [Candidatus Enterovibrio luxaltus]
MLKHTRRKINAILGCEKNHFDAIIHSTTMNPIILNFKFLFLVIG